MKVSYLRVHLTQCLIVSQYALAVVQVASRTVKLSDLYKHSKGVIIMNMIIHRFLSQSQLSMNNGASSYRHVASFPDIILHAS